MQELTLHNVPFNHLYADLSYAEFFARYYPRRDGKVYAATYSFNHSQMDFWWRLEPTSVLYIGSKFSPNGLAFVRRFPLFEVRSVGNLHTKAVFFERSGVLLIGSENIYGSKSAFAEVMLETVVPERHRKQVIDLIFGRLRGLLLTATYTVDDIRIHAGGSVAEGRPFLPCHRETPYWEIIGPPSAQDQRADDPSHLTLPPPEPRQYHRWIYHVKQYDIDGTPHGVAFDRGYVYCGDLDATALGWLLENCEVIQRRPGCGPIEQDDDTMLKDRFYRYHPIAGTRESDTDFWIGPARDTALWRHLEEVLPDER